MSNAEVRGRFVWHELLTTDTAAAASFYSRIVPWRSQPANMPGYTIFMSGPSQVAGLMTLPPRAVEVPAHWRIYVGTADVDATCSQAQSLGGRVSKAPAEIPGVGRFAVLADPQGATFAVFTPGSGSPPAAPAFGGFSWHELATTDMPGAVRFYGELFGWKKGVTHDMGALGIYQLFEHSGAVVGGICGTQVPATPPSWLSYVHVADSSRAVSAVKSAGGRLLHGPVEVPGGSWIALFMDPQGGAFAVHEMPRVLSPPAPAHIPTPTARKPPMKARPPREAAVKARRFAAKKVGRRAPARKKPARKAAAVKASARKVPARKQGRARGATKRSSRGGVKNKAARGGRR